MNNIYDIAEKSGFSASTVARALSGKGYVKEATKQKILTVADALGYKPSHSARSLRSQKTDKILMCIPDLYNPFYFNLIDGANNVLEQHGYHIILFHSKRLLEEELKAITMLNERYGDGLLIGSFDFNPTNVEAMKAAKMPIVALFNSIPQDSGLDCVYVDQRKAMYLAACHLIEAGHTRIGVLNGEISNGQTGRQRYEGFAQALKTHGLDIAPDRVITSNFTREYTHTAVAQHIARHGGMNMTAIVAANTLMAIGCIDACKEAGVAIPEDLSIVSLDNTDVTTCTSPKLTVVDMHQEDVGKKAALLLLEQLQGRAEYSKTVVVEPTLVPRGSVNALKAL